MSHLERWRHTILLRLQSIVHRDRAEQDLDDELRFHIEQETARHMARGLPPAQARQEARRAMYGVEAVKDACRDARRFQWIDGAIGDVRYALRTLRRSPGFTSVAVVTLAVGIGVNAAVFTVTDAVLFKGFRLIDRNDRILYIHSEKDGGYAGVSYPDFEDWRTQASRSFDGIGAVGSVKVLCDESGFPEVCSGTRITSNAFGLLGRTPFLGRDFAAADERPGAAPVAILSYGFWERRFGKDPAVVGQALHLRMAEQLLQVGEAPPERINPPAPLITIIGVMPMGFAFPQDQDFWLPLVPTTPDVGQRDGRSLWFAFGRLRDGVTRETARAELETIGRRLASAYPQTNQGHVPRLESFTEFFLDKNAPTIYRALWAAVGFVLLIACANLANLLLARATGRSREMAVRTALGAGRWRIVRQLLIESLVLSFIGGMCGWAIASWGVRTYGLATNPPVGQWNRNLLDYTMDFRVLAYLLAISLGGGLLFGLAPALWFSKLNINAVMKNGGPGATGGRGGRHLSGLLVIAEVALAVMLLAGAGLMMHSFLNMSTADIGARTANMAEMLLRLPAAKYPSRERQVSFYDRLKARLEAIPGVESAALGTSPASGISRPIPYELAGGAAVDERRRTTTVVRVIGSDYFRTLGASVLSGREFTSADGASALPAVVVNQQFANKHWPGANAIGQRLRLFNGEKPDAWLTVIGVASNVMHDPRRQEIVPAVYVPYAQTPRAEEPWLLVRAAPPAGGVVPILRREVNAEDPDVIMWLGPYLLRDRLMVGIYGSTRNQTALFFIFAVVALLLASTGVYAVLAHSVSLRTQEIGVRAALGATAGDILALVFRQGMVPVTVGLMIGLVGAIAVTPVLKSQLIGVSTTDPLTFLAASATLMLAATLGCLIPARRATRVDPLVALRQE